MSLWHPKGVAPRTLTWSSCRLYRPSCSSQYIPRTACSTSDGLHCYSQLQMGWSCSSTTMSSA